MEIKVGEYVRTKQGKIGKFKKYLKSLYFVGQDIELENCIIYLEDEDEVTKHSKNIIDLIEVGDYVNESKVIDIAQGKKRAIYVEQVTTGALAPILEKNIKSILTHEQFSSLEYII